jgi:hypothetical protein
MIRASVGAPFVMVLVLLAGCGGNSTPSTGASQLADVSNDPILKAATIGLAGAESITAPTVGDQTSGSYAATSDSRILHIPAGADPAVVFQAALKALAARGVAWASIVCEPHKLYNAGGSKSVSVAGDDGKTWTGSVTLGLELDPSASIGSIQGPYLQVSIDVDQVSPSPSASPATGRAPVCP